MKWDKQIQEAVAIAASAAGGCESWLTHHLKAAREAGLEEENIVRALKLAGRIRQVTSGKIEDMVGELERKGENTEKS